MYALANDVKPPHRLAARRSGGRGPLPACAARRGTGISGIPWKTLLPLPISLDILEIFQHFSLCFRHLRQKYLH
jgi:hypothetical protein